MFLGFENIKIIGDHDMRNFSRLNGWGPEQNGLSEREGKEWGQSCLQSRQLFQDVLL